MINPKFSVCATIYVLTTQCNTDYHLTSGEMYYSGTYKVTFLFLVLFPDLNLSTVHSQLGNIIFIPSQPFSLFHLEHPHYHSNLYWQPKSLLAHRPSAQ